MSATSSRSKPALTLPPTLVGSHLAVDERTIAQALGMSLEWVRKDRRTARVLPFMRIGRCVRYNPAAVMQALAATQEGGPTC